MCIQHVKMHLHYFVHTVAEDFVGSAVDVTFFPGDTQVQVTVPTTDDNVLEQTEEFFARATQFNSRVAVFESRASITIQDNDGRGKFPKK